ncbi:hypothetical protein DTO282F9_7321 [Paecilomyces variotii]|nr:hypothetical protein DTO282E5_4224 [Paecilomyces variotii]KAJ9395701.1 hypothetical protein DTO282F9_7321 [Paecilomyces variotii]
MKFLKHIRSRSKNLNGAGKDSKDARHSPKASHSAPRYGNDFTKRLPREVLTQIFAEICPHSLDDSYSSSEESMTEDGCMLCDMRDLANCALACKRWLSCAQPLLYQHVRIDPVHYCELEVELAAKRKRRSWFDRNGEAIDAPKVRLALFMRTVRENQELANMVLSLRTPYMTREVSKAELARTVSVLPNLRYVDLPAGLYSDEISSQTLKQELMARCIDIRRMRYAHGSEGSFSRIPGSRLWMSLEVLELSRLQVEPSTLRWVLNSFPMLRDLKIEDFHWLDDTIFASAPSVPLFPPVQRLTLEHVPNVTASGFATYLSMPQNREALTHLTVSSTGILPQSLHVILSAAPYLRTLSIIQEMSRPFPMEDIPPLSSKSLRLLHYEVTYAGCVSGHSSTATSYYTYLISSLMSSSLPALRDLYVRDADFPDTLLLSPPPRLLGGGENGPQMFSMGLNQPLNIYSKGMDELEWNFTPYEPPSTRGRRDSTTRPVSFHGAQLSPSWGGQARRSVLVGNGFGGYLAVPVDDGRPKSSGGLKNEKQDLWR